MTIPVLELNYDRDAIQVDGNVYVYDDSNNLLKTISITDSSVIWTYTFPVGLVSSNLTSNSNIDINYNKNIEPGSGNLRIFNDLDSLLIILPVDDQKIQFN